MLSVRSRGMDWVCEARGAGIKTVVQTIDSAGWVCCAVVLLRDVKRVEQASHLGSYSAHYYCPLPGLAVAGAADPASTEGSAVRARVCACSLLPQVGVRGRGGEDCTGEVVGEVVVAESEEGEEEEKQW